MEIREGKETSSLYQMKGLNYAIQHDLYHPRPDMLTLVAKKNGKIAGVAGSSQDSETMWQIDIDVFPQYRGYGLATALTNHLSKEILNRGVVPYYGTASSNIPSQKVAYKAGFFPSWMCVYHTRLIGHNTLPTG